MWGGDAHSVRGLVTGLVDGMVDACAATPEEWMVRSRSSYAFAVRNSWDKRGERMFEVYQRLC